LVLRPLGLDDFKAVQSWAQNPANTRYMAWGPNTEEQTREFLGSAKPGKDFAVVLKESGEVIGSCGIYPNEANDTGVVGWILHMDHWKQGFGTEFGGELIRYGFKDLALRRIYAPCAAANYGSRRVMERNGMRLEALHIKAFWARVDKEWIDEVVYAILAEEYGKDTSNISNQHSSNDPEQKFGDLPGTLSDSDFKRLPQPDVSLDMPREQL
jgi:RimJ/RimL family protein N-acetyltransferase